MSVHTSGTRITDHVSRVRWALTLGGVAVLVGLAGPASALGAVGDVPDPNDVCGQAWRLVGEGRPGDALELINTLRYAQPTGLPSTETGMALPAPDDPRASCAAVRSVALVAITRAERLVGFSSDAATLDAAWSSLRRGETTPADLATAQAPVTGSVPLVKACLPGTDDASRLDALTTSSDVRAVDKSWSAAGIVQAAAEACDGGQAADPPTRSETGAKAWDGVVTHQLEPLKNRAIAVAILVLALLVLGRLGSRLMPERGGPGRHRRLTTVAQAVGIVLIGFASAYAVAVVSTSGRRVVAAGLVAVVGMGLFAWSQAWNMALTVVVTDATGAEKPALAGQVIALLGEMGGADPQGLLAPRGLDVTDLSQAGLDAVPANALAKLAWALLRLLQPRAPWRASVDVTSDDVHSVQVFHNGRPISTTLVDRQTLRLAAVEGDKPDEKVVPDLFRMSASVVLCALHERYRFAGLHRNPDWRSIGYHDLATTQFGDRTSPKVEYLARAVALDPANRTAEVALWSARFREATEPKELTLYLGFLTAMERDLLRRDGGIIAPKSFDPEHPMFALYVRVLLAHASTAINRNFARPEPLATVDDGGAVMTVVALAAKAASNPRVSRFAAQAGQLAGAWRVIVQAPGERSAKHAEPTLRRAEQALKAAYAGLVRRPERTPLADYAWACTYATLAFDRIPPSDDDPPDGDEHWTRLAIACIRAADADPALKAWRAKDPQLERLVHSPAFAEQFAEQVEFADAAWLKPFGEKLAAMGVRDTESLLAAAETFTDRVWLAEKLGTTPGTVERLVRQARSEGSAT